MAAAEHLDSFWASGNCTNFEPKPDNQDYCRICGWHRAKPNHYGMLCILFYRALCLNLFSSFCFLVVVCDFLVKSVVAFLSWFFQFSFLISVVNIYFLLFIDFFCLVLVFSSVAQPQVPAGLICCSEFAFHFECRILVS